MVSTFRHVRSEREWDRAGNPAQSLINNEKGSDNSSLPFAFAAIDMAAYAVAGVRCCLARPQSFSNPAASLIAMSDRTLRSSNTLAFLRALMNRP